MSILVLLVWAASVVFAYGYFIGLNYSEQKDTIGLDMDTIFMGLVLSVGGPFTIATLAWVFVSDYNWKRIFTKPYFTMTPEQPRDPKYRRVYPKDRRNRQ